VLGGVASAVLAVLLVGSRRREHDRRADYQRTVEQLELARSHLAAERDRIAAERRELDAARTLVADDRAALERSRELREREGELATRDRALLEELQRRRGG